MIGWPAPASVKPAASMPCAEPRRVALQLSLQLVPDWSISSTCNVVAAMAGASELLNRYGRDRCRSQSTISLRPLV